mgnify:CR=1 FL=1
MSMTKDEYVAPVVLNDSQGVVALAKNLVRHNASKHIEVRYHFIRDCVINRKLGLDKVSTTKKFVNEMMKSLSIDLATDGRGDDFVPTTTKVVLYHHLCCICIFLFLL